MNLLQAMDDLHLFARWFRRPEVWLAWRAFLAALFALPMGETELALYRQCTGRTLPPISPFAEGWLICGRRAGKSFVLALIVVFRAAFQDYREYLAPGERATVLVIATDRKQARTIMRYIRAMLTEIPMLARLVERETAEAFDLTNRVTIEVATASYRTVRGYTVCAAACDELAFWPSDDAADPDYAVLDALRPAMATIPTATLLCASSPYARRGALWDAHHRWYSKDDAPALVWQAATRTMNPTVPQRVIDDATERDPANAAAEYLAQFRGDIEGFVSREAVMAVVTPGATELGPLRREFEYFAFVDPSGGTSDSMTLAVAHLEKGRGVLDCLRERRAPFSPEDVVEEFAMLLKRYGCGTVVGDRYAGEWPREAFKRHGISYTPSTKPKSDIYKECLPRINAREVALLDNPRLINQLVGLERRTARGGRDSIDHPPGGHDDLANAAAGVLLHLTKPRPTTFTTTVKGLY